jgi:glycosyltransferase involved in cell wall biosynthesis
MVIRPQPRPVALTHIIGGLEVGGAEMLLYELLKRTDRSRFRPEVVSLTTVGPVGERIRSLEIPVCALGSSGVPASVLVIGRLVRHLRSTRPDAVQTWMYHADLLGGMAARLAGTRHVVWGIHAGRPAPDATIASKAGVRVAAVLSRIVPSRIIACSEESRRIHAEYGYAPDRMEVIRNGFDVTDAPVDPVDLHAELGVPTNALLVGRVARDHPQKDIPTLLDAWPTIADHIPEAHLVVAGTGLSADNANLHARVSVLRGGDRIHLLGRRDDIMGLHATFDVEVSSSAFGEGLPLVLGEAMSVATPVVATDVGDSAYLVGDLQRCVPAMAPQALAAAVVRILQLPAEVRAHLGARDCDRVRRHFDLRSMIEAYETVYSTLIDGVS